MIGSEGVDGGGGGATSSPRELKNDGYAGARIGLVSGITLGGGGGNCGCTMVVAIGLMRLVGFGFVPASRIRHTLQ